MTSADLDRIKRLGFVAGLIAGLPMAALMFALSSIVGLPTLPDLFADPLLFLLPGPIFGLLIDALQFSAKSLLLAGLLEGQLLFCGWVGRIWAGRAFDCVRPRPWREAAIVAGVVFIAFEGVVLTLLGMGFLGAALPTGMVVGLVGYGALHAVYAVGLVFAFGWLGERKMPQSRPSSGGRGDEIGRRRVVTTLAVSSVAIVGGGTFWRVAGGATVAGSSGGGLTGELSPEVTPTDQFYTVSKNFADPHVDAATWRLQITGLVERPTTLTLDALRALPATEQYFTLACISNLVGGDLIGNARWRGVKLRDLLNAAGVKPGVRKVVLSSSADSYSDSITFDKAMEETTLLAYEMNGEPLTYKHGAPARLLIPGIYGMKNVKWVTRIELVDREFLGYWQERGWSDAAAIQTFSRIDVPIGGRTVAGPIQIGGVAHAGDRGIKKVEVSTDGGRTWLEANRKPPLSPNSWTIWTLDWTPPGPGAYQLKVRATDGLDRVQDATIRDSFPDGATGYHSVSVRVI